MDGNTWEGWEKWEKSEEGFAALRLPFGLPFGREHFVVASLREPHTGLAADSCCKTSSSAARFKERRCVAKIVQRRCGCYSNHTVFSVYFEEPVHLSVLLFLLS